MACELREHPPYSAQVRKETWVISLKVFPVEIYQYGYC